MGFFKESASFWLIDGKIIIDIFLLLLLMHIFLLLLPWPSTTDSWKGYNKQLLLGQSKLEASWSKDSKFVRSPAVLMGG